MNQTHEEKLAYLERTLDDLNDVVVAQGREIDRLRHQVNLLIERAAEVETSGAAVIGDERPPHW